MRVLTPPDHHSRIITVLCIAIAFAGSCPADRPTVDEKNSWGNSPELSEPRLDSKGRGGRWWWPQPSNHGKSETAAKGNGGRVFSSWTPLKEPDSVEPAPPHPEQPPPREPERHLILNNIIFPNDSAELTKWGRAEVDRIVDDLKQLRWFEFHRNDKIICIGHTNDIGSDSYNMELGLRRARAVANHMVAQGIGADFVQVRSVGESEPIVPNDTPTNRALNRCVAFWIEIGD